MASFNKVILIGNMTADPELKQTQGGLSVCSFSIAVNRRFKTEGQQDCDFINIVAWRQQAEFVTRYFKKGQPILVCGRLENREWTDKNGSKRISTEIIAEEICFVGGNDSDTANKSQSQPYVPSAYTQNNQNFEEIPNDGSLPF